MEILWEGKVSIEFRAIFRTICKNCAFPENFHTRKLGGILVFYAVTVIPGKKIILLIELKNKLYIPYQPTGEISCITLKFDNGNSLYSRLPLSGTLDKLDFS